MGETQKKSISPRRIKQNVIGKKHRFFAIVQPGFEETSKKELMELGVKEFLNSAPGGIEFKAKLNDCFRINICSRTITRLLMRLTSFKAIFFNVLNRKISEFPWELYLSDKTQVVFSVTSKKSKLYHTDRIKEECCAGIRARVKKYNQEIRFCKKDNGFAQKIMVRFNGDKCSISLDTSGGFLYKRGKRTHVIDATIRETIAAMILREAGWPNYKTLMDPMCGSGVFSLEAADMAIGRPANEDREFPFMAWPSFKPAAYAYLKKKLPYEQFEEKTILASDDDPKAIEVIKSNIINSGLGKQIKVTKSNFLENSLSENKNALLVLNPPYGKRLNKKNTEKLYRQIGKQIRQSYKGGYAIIVPGLEYEKILSLKYDKKILFMNGGLKVSVIIKY